MRRLVLASVLAASCFLWGYLAHRNRIFPYWLLVRSVLDAGMVSQHRPSLRAQDRVDVLADLPYLHSSADPHSENRGVIIQQRDKTYRGFNLYSVHDDRSGVFLADMDGEILHRWDYPHFSPADAASTR